MKQVKRILCLVLACVIMCSLLPMTALAADVIVKSIEFSVGHIQAGAGGTDLLVTINEYQPVSFTGMSVLRHDNAGAYGNIVKSSEKLEAGKNYWLCVNLELKSGYTFTPYMMQQPSSWKINNLPKGVSVDKISMSGSNIKFRLTALPSFTPAFIEEPEDTAMEMETDVYDAQWEVNFVPHKYEYYCGDSRYQYSVYTITQKKFSETFSVNHYYKYFIRAYYGKGENDYIDSSKFSIRVPGMYCIETDTQGGDPVPGGWPITNKLGKLETMPVTENGIMIFEGWYTAPTGGEKVTTETVFEKDSTIYARWKPPVTYNVIAGNYGVYYLGGSADTLPFTIDCDFSKFTGVEWNGEMLNPSYYTAKAGKSGTTVVELKKAFLETLTHESYAFRFMCSDGQAYASFTVKEIPTYTVTFNANGGSAVAAQTVKEGKTAKEPAAPTKEGLDFFGWYTKDGELYEFETPVTGNIALYAKFGYTVLFWLDSSDEYAIAWRNVEPGQKAEEQAEPAQEGKIFLGWYTSDGKKFDFNTPINSHLNLYAKFEDEKPAVNTYTVTFDPNGGSAVATQTVESGKAAAKPADPTKSGYTFKGWYLGSTKYDFSKPVTGNITLKAKWEKKAAAHTHTYNDDVDGTCNGCGVNRETVETRKVVHMFRMYNPNTGEHFYTGSTVERDNLIAVGWQYEGVGFTFPANTGAPVYRLFHEPTGEHLYTMSKEEKEMLEAEGWNYEGIAFNSAYDTEAVQHRLHNPNADVGAYHFTFSLEEKQNLINAGWEYQGIGWYSCWK